MADPVPGAPTIVDASVGGRLADARTLFREYAAELPIALDFQGFEAELKALPGRYAPPRGRLLLALVGDAPAGCIALRELAADPDGTTVCEMKRMHVRKEYRRQGIGRRLATAIIAEARTVGYDKMRLDTLASMTPALELYGALGFRFIDAYCYNPIADARYLELDLTTSS